MQNQQNFYSHQNAMNHAFEALFSFCPTVIQHQLMKDVMIKKISSDTVFIRKGDECDGIYIVLDGALKIYMNDSQKRIIRFAGIHEVVGESSFAKGTLYKYHVAALNDSVLAYIPFSKLQELMLKQPRVFFSLMNVIHKQTAMVENHSLMLLAEPSERLVIRTIQDLKGRFGVDSHGYIKLRVSVKELAGYIGMSKTSLYRILRSLKEKNLLSQHLHKIKPASIL